MKYLVIGADGQLGTDLCGVLKNEDLVPLTQNEIEITSMESVAAAMSRYHPDIVINTAAFIRVDDCESMIDKAYSVNALGARNVAVQTQKTGAKLIHISTDYVFGGETQIPDNGYTEFDNPVPLNIYGKSKLAGEVLVRDLCQRFIIVRSSGLFGTAGALGKGGNFIETILKKAMANEELRVVNDQFFSPTYTLDLSERIKTISQTEFYGVIHVTNSGVCSWYEFACFILETAGIKADISPLPSNQYPQKARRPFKSVLKNYQSYLLGMPEMRHWRDALKDYMLKKGHISRVS